MAASRVATEKPKFTPSITSAFTVPPPHPRSDEKLKMMNESSFLMNPRLTTPTSSPNLRMFGSTQFPLSRDKSTYVTGSMIIGRDQWSANRRARVEQEEESKVFSCSFCRSNFSTSQALGGHQNAHKQERTLAKLRHASGADTAPNKYKPLLGVRHDSTIQKPWTSIHDHHPSAADILRMLDPDCHYHPLNDHLSGGFGSFSGCAAAETPDRERKVRMMDKYPNQSGMMTSGGFAQFSGSHSAKVGAATTNGQPLMYGRGDFFQRMEEIGDIDANGIDLSLKL